jgi:hypothetical protein
LVSFCLLSYPTTGFILLAFAAFKTGFMRCGAGPRWYHNFINSWRVFKARAKKIVWIRLFSSMLPSSKISTFEGCLSENSYDRVFDIFPDLVSINPGWASTNMVFTKRPKPVSIVCR